MRAGLKQAKRAPPKIACLRSLDQDPAHASSSALKNQYICAALSRSNGAPTYRALWPSRSLQSCSDVRRQQ